MSAPQRDAPPPNAEAEKPTTNANPKKKNFQREKPKIDKSKLPQPKKKSTESTPLTDLNDPLWQETFVIEGETGVSSQKAAQDFKADAAGYVHLVEEEYKAISDNDKHYAKSVPASAHAYYHHILLWYKYAVAAQKHGTASTEQERSIHFVNGYQAVCRAGSGAYLAGLGDYEDATGVKHLLSAREPNKHGHFGHIVANNHGEYEHLPAPASSLQRVMEDVAISTERAYNQRDNWMLAGLAPAGAPAAPLEREPAPDAARRARQAARDAEEQGQEAQAESDDEPDNAEEEVPQPEEEERPRNSPTVNLLGWRPATQLVKNQLAEIRFTIANDERNINDLHLEILPTSLSE